jgi:16S rRNA A1518/A1519 N6-dimethyltransferase RsmA/KsgA/DIM1 with predicted DNA glycosylase/AP lyase activity
MALFIAYTFFKDALISSACRTVRLQSNELEVMVKELLNIPTNTHRISKICYRLPWHISSPILASVCHLQGDDEAKKFTQA